MVIKGFEYIDRNIIKWLEKITLKILKTIKVVQKTKVANGLVVKKVIKQIKWNKENSFIEQNLARD